MTRSDAASAASPAALEQPLQHASAVNTSNASAESEPESNEPEATERPRSDETALAAESTTNANTPQFWPSLLAIAGGVVAILGAFLAPPPVTESVTWVNLGRYLVAAAVGIMAVPAYGWRLRKHAAGWCLSAALLLCVGVGLYFSYDAKVTDWTREYNRKRIVIGSQYTTDATTYREKEFVKNGSWPTDEDLIMDYGGQIDLIWPREEIRGHRRQLAALYIGCILAFAVATLSISHGLGCLGWGQDSKGRK